MTVLTHMAVGGAVGSLFGGTGTALAAGVVSHIPLDLVPHYDFPNPWVELGIGAAFIAAMVAMGFALTPAFWGALGGALPDLENLLWKKGIIPAKWKLFPGHNRRLARFLPHGRSAPPSNLMWQLLIVVASLWVIGRGLSTS